jgi:hypothetical protein
MASAGVVSGVVTLTVAFSEYITSGVINPQTLSGALGALGLAAGNLSFNNGTGSLQTDTLYAKPLTLSATPTTVDFTSVTDPGNASVTFARSRLFFVYNPAATAGYDCGVYHGASNGWAQLPASANPLYARYGGGFILLVDPTSTGAGNGDVITSTSKTVVFDPGANTLTVYVIMAGGSAA